MKCPECGKKILYVRVYSECWQRGNLTGNKIKSYGIVETENVSHDICGIGCPECGEDITKSIET